MSEIEKNNQNELNLILANTNENIQNLAKIAKDTAIAVEQVSKRINIHETEIEQIKYKEKITDRQSGVIRETAKRKVSTLVDVKGPYFGKFMSDIYRHLRKNHFLGSKINTTTKGNYDEVLEGIKLYNPDVKKIKAEHDEYLRQKQEYARKLLMEEINE